MTVVLVAVCVEPWSASLVPWWVTLWSRLTVVGQLLCLLPFYMQVALTGAFRERAALSVSCLIPVSSHLLNGCSWPLSDSFCLSIHQLHSGLFAFCSFCTTVLLSCCSASFTCPVCTGLCYMHDRSRWSMWTTELLSLGLYAACTQRLFVATESQWTKLGTQTHKHLLKFLEKMDSFHKDAIHGDLLLPSCGADTAVTHTHARATASDAGMQTDVHSNTHTVQWSLSHLSFKTGFLLFTQSDGMWCFHHALVVQGIYIQPWCTVQQQKRFGNRISPGIWGILGINKKHT